MVDMTSLREVDFLNPILVREVRQSLRGRYFRFAFWISLCLVAIIGLGALIAIDPADPLHDGRSYFLAVYGCLAIAVCGFVPFAAFLAMGSEWEENTYDLLLLSNLTSRQVVTGKLVASITQSLLYLCAFGPFLAVAFLMRGVDLWALLVSVALVLLIGTGLSAIALGLSSMTRNRWARVVLLAAVAAGLFGTVIAMITFGSEVMRNPGQLREPDFWRATLGFVVFVLIVGASGVFIAMSRLDHSAENRSSGLRILCVLGLTAMQAWMVLLFLETSDLEIISAFSAFLLGFLLPAFLFFSTEEEQLGRRQRASVPRQWWLAALMTPFLPGGGRSVWLALLVTVQVWAVASVAALGPRGGSFYDWTNDGFWLLAVMTAFWWIYLYLLPPFLARKTGTLFGRSVLRGVMVAGVVLAAVMPAFIGFLIGNRDWTEMEHCGHPLWLMSRLERGMQPQFRANLVVIATVAGLAILFNVPRAFAGLRETLALSSVRRRAQSSDSLKHAPTQ